MASPKALLADILMVLALGLILAAAIELVLRVPLDLAAGTGLLIAFFVSILHFFFTPRPPHVKDEYLRWLKHWEKLPEAEFFKRQPKEVALYPAKPVVLQSSGLLPRLVGANAILTNQRLVIGWPKSAGLGRLLSGHQAPKAESLSLWHSDLSKNQWKLRAVRLLSAGGHPIVEFRFRLGFREEYARLFYHPKAPQIVQLFNLALHGHNRPRPAVRPDMEQKPRSR